MCDIEAFLTRHREALLDFWDRAKAHLAEWRESYAWPPGCTPEVAVERRAELERSIQATLREQKGCLDKATFDSILIWGFGAASVCSEADIRRATKDAFSYLGEHGVADAARALVQLPGIGVSRASKVLALSDQDKFEIYDSRSAHGLSDLRDGSHRPIIAIPPGRVVRGHTRPAKGFCCAFQEYIWVLQYLRDLAAASKIFGGQHVRVADLEMAFFARSRAGDREIPLPIPPAEPPAHLRSVAGHDEESLFWTLADGKKARQFRVIFGDTSVTVLTGERGRTPCELRQEQISNCLEHFGQGWFPLSNSKTAKDRDPNGLGEYFYQTFGSSVFASHFAALWVHQGRLAYKKRGGAIWLISARRGQHGLH